MVKRRAFSYKEDGNRIEQVDPDRTKTIRIDGVYEEDRNSGGTVTGTRVYYAAGGAMRVNGTLYFVMGDNLGSAVLTLDSTGNTVGQERYFPFGSVRFASGTMQTDRLYTGQRNVASLGLLDYHARFYDPYLNRFISADSVIPSYANPQSLDRYSYVLNSPIDYSDPSGMKPCWATAHYSCNLKKMTKNQANAIVAQYKPSDQGAVVSFFRSQGVPVSDLHNTHGLIERQAPSVGDSSGTALPTSVGVVAADGSSALATSDTSNSDGSVSAPQSSGPNLGKIVEGAAIIVVVDTLIVAPIVASFFLPGAPELEVGMLITEGPWVTAMASAVIAVNVYGGRLIAEGIGGK